MSTKLIFDIGAHQGEDTEFYLQKGFSVIAVEANPDLVAQLRLRFSFALDSGKLTVVDKAMGVSNGTIDFYKYDQATVWGTTDPSYVERNKQFAKEPTIVVVKTVSMLDLIQTYGCPYYVKIDIEGADTTCLKGLADSEIKPKFLSVEASATDMHEVREQVEILIELGYQQFKIVGQHRVHQQQPPFPPREGDYVAYRFAGGESGLFGAEAPGDWTSEAKAMKVFERFFRQARLTSQHIGIFRNVKNRYVRAVLGRIAPDGTGWYDIHAMR